MAEERQIAPTLWRLLYCFKKQGGAEANALIQSRPTPQQTSSNEPTEAIVRELRLVYQKLSQRQLSPEGDNAANAIDKALRELESCTGVGSALSPSIVSHPDARIAGRRILEMSSRQSRPDKVPPQAEFSAGGPEFSAGDLVRAKGLEVAAHLNGRVGTICGFDNELSRYVVDFGKGEQPSVKPGNLEKVAVEQAASEKATAEQAALQNAAEQAALQAALQNAAAEKDAAEQVALNASSRKPFVPFQTLEQAAAEKDAAEQVAAAERDERRRRLREQDAAAEQVAAKKAAAERAVQRTSLRLQDAAAEQVAAKKAVAEQDAAKKFVAAEEAMRNLSKVASNAVKVRADQAAAEEAPQATTQTQTRVAATLPPTGSAAPQAPIPRPGKYQATVASVAAAKIVPVLKTPASPSAQPPRAPTTSLGAKLARAGRATPPRAGTPPRSPTSPVNPIQGRPSDPQQRQTTSPTSPASFPGLR